MFEVLCQGKMFFPPEHKKKVASPSHCTWFYFKYLDKARPRVLSRKYRNSRVSLIFTIHRQDWGMEDVRNIRETMC